MVDQLLVFSDPASRALRVFLDRRVASLPPVLLPFLATADMASFHCSVLYSPYNLNAHAMTQLQAESYPRVEDHGGWQYGSVSSSKKFAVQLPVREWPCMGQLLTVALLTPVHSLVMAFVRSCVGVLLCQLCQLCQPRRRAAHRLHVQLSVSCGHFRGGQGPPLGYHRRSCHHPNPMQRPTKSKVVGDRFPKPLL